MNLASSPAAGEARLSSAAPEPRRSSKPGRWLWRIVLALVTLAIAYNAWLFVRVWWLREHNPGTTAFMQQGLERLQEKNPKAQIQQRWVPYEQISVHLKRAVIAAEDQKFLDHEGFDWEEVEKAYDRNRARGRVVRGASTISQQLAKNLFLSAQKTYVRKAQEAVITLMIEGLLEKRRILELYLNVVEWGEGVYGAEAAARHYFSVSAAALNEEQAARLAAMLPRPNYYDRRRDSPYLERRTEDLRRYMPMMAVP